METLKKNLTKIVIALLVVFSLTKCTQSCNRANAYDSLLKETDSIQLVMQEENELLSDSIVKLNTAIRVYEERVAGMKQSLDIQDEAAKRIASAKQNIQVNVRQQRVQ